MNINNAKDRLYLLDEMLVARQCGLCKKIFDIRNYEKICSHHLIEGEEYPLCHYCYESVSHLTCPPLKFFGKKIEVKDEELKTGK